MPLPIALQLYSVRDALAQDFDGTLERVAAMGYAGVETGDFMATPAAVAAQRFQSLGLSVCGYHHPLPLGEKAAAVLETLAAFDCRRLLLAWQPEEMFTSRDGIQRVADLLNEGSAWAQANGLSLGYHNHWGEFYKLDGRPAHDYLRAAVRRRSSLSLTCTGRRPAAVTRPPSSAS
jgi:sugar phosphate isomerase/epimerase